MKQDVYNTKDLYEASLLYSLGKKFVGLKQENSFYWFQFEDRDSCERIANSYWGKEISVNAKTYAEAIRTLKDRLFARA